MTTRRRLSDHINEGLDVVLAAALRGLAVSNPPDPEAAEAALRAWREGPHDFEIEAFVDRTSKGRWDTRSLAVRVWVLLPSGRRAELCTVRVRDLCDEHGVPVDSRESARTLLLQLGVGVPDDVSALLDDQG